MTQAGFSKMRGPGERITLWGDCGWRGIRDGETQTGGRPVRQGPAAAAEGPGLDRLQAGPGDGAAPADHQPHRAGGRPQVVYRAQAGRGPGGGGRGVHRATQGAREGGRTMISAKAELEHAVSTF